MSKNKETPMMTQFNAVKKQFPDSILFFRMGDFYEMFGEDAKIAAKVLGITLTARNKSSDNHIPMCGVPHHSHKQYLMKLISAGYKVAICEQLEDPALAKGLVKRGVIRVVSQGTVMDDEEVPSSENNFLLAVYQDDFNYYLAASDVSTGEVFIADGTENNIRELISSFSPKEVLLSSHISDLDISGTISIKAHKSANKAAKSVENHYKLLSYEHLGLRDIRMMIPLNMLFEYVKDSMLEVLFCRPSYVAKDEHLVVDKIALRTLDLLDSTASKGHSLYSVLNHTLTPMGARMLKWWITHPSRNREIIEHRLDRVGYFIEDWGFTQSICSLLSEIYDIERITNRIASKRVTPRDLISLKNSLKQLPYIADMLESTGFEIIANMGDSLSKCTHISNIIESAIKDQPSQNLKEGGIIKDGYNKMADELRDIQLNGRQMLASMEAELKKNTGINQLKVSYNKVFGYYIEVTKSNLSKVPSYFERKQTLVSAERFVTPELKELENKILNAEDKLAGLEYELFCSLRNIISDDTEHLRVIAKDIASIDCHISLAKAANKNSYCRPTISYDSVLDISDARHPMVETNLNDVFIANDVFLDNNENRLMIITGPNMSGKSTYIRSIAVIVVMAHIGSFVPASSAKIPLTDRIFTRVGASDNISKGESTFMVEMVETSNILAHATSESLVILDEIGRGTSTFDGVSIAWAVTEYILNEIKAKTLFATHYHELTEIAQDNGARNYTISVKEQEGDIIFLRKIIKGAADKSYGIYVAKLAGIPAKVTERAKEILEQLEEGKNMASQPDATVAKTSDRVIVKPILIFDEEHPALLKLKNIDINSLTPIEALQILNEVKMLSLK